MSSYIFIKNFYFEEIQQLAQEQFNTNYDESSLLEAKILMKNSRSHYIVFNEDLAQEELIDWMNLFHLNMSNTTRETIIEGFQAINNVDYKVYYINDDLYAIDSNNQSYKIEDLEEFVSLEDQNINFIKTEIPSKNIHEMAIIKHFVPKKKWWKFW